jgi:DNA-binding SARP family transcriptional activator/Tol biopolymer transport system component
MTQLRLFGRPEILRSAATPALIERNISSELFIFIADMRDVSRDKLCETFWPDGDDDRGRHSLSQALFLLRKIHGDCVVSKADRIVLLPNVHVDTHSFTQLAAARDPRALDVYGGPFVDEWSPKANSNFGQWLDGRRRTYEVSYRRSVMHHVRELTAAGEQRQALSCLTAAISRAPGEEDLRIEAIRLSVANGASDEALRQYEMYREYCLNNDLEPIDTIEQLVTDVLAKATLRLRVTKAPAPAVQATGTTASITGSPVPSQQSLGGQAPQPSSFLPMRLRLPRAVPHRMRWVLSGAMAVLALGFIVALTRNPPASTSHSATFELQLPAGIGIEMWQRPLVGSPFSGMMALSRDGARLAFLGTDTAEGVGVFIRNLDRIAVQRIPQTWIGWNLTFSPSGESLAFTRIGSIMRARLDGQAPVLLTDSSWKSLSWADDGDLIAGRGSTIWRVSAAGTRKQLIANLDGLSGHLRYSEISVLPGGRSALLTISKLGGTQLGVADLRDGAVRELALAGSSPRYIRGGYILFLSTHNELMAAPFSMRRRELTGPAIRVTEDLPINRAGVASFATSDDAVVYHPIVNELRSLLVVDETGSARALRVDPRFYECPRVSPDGKYLAVSFERERSRTDKQFDSSHDIWILTLPDGPLVKLQSDAVSNRCAQWTGDSRSVMYLSQRSPRLTQELWVQSVDGSAPEHPLVQLQATPKFKGADKPGIRDAAISADGRYVFFEWEHYADHGLSYRRVGSDTTSFPILRLTRQSERTNPRLSPDGKWLAYTAGSMLYVRSFPELGAPLRVSLGQGHQPAWSRDGRRLYYKQANQIVVLNVSTEPKFQVLSHRIIAKKFMYTAASQADFDVAPDDQSVIVTTRDGIGRLIMIQDLAQKLEARYHAQN